MLMAREEIEVEVMRLTGNDDIPLPDYQSEEAVGMDLRAAVTGDVAIRPGEILLVPCGFAVAIPPGFEGQVRPRSGLAARSGVGVVNAPGTIDPDYRGEVKVALANFGKEAVTITRGMRIAQLVVMPVPRVRWKPVDALSKTGRGSGGFGHTGR
jgi:dUTP pyrophosphatase